VRDAGRTAPVPDAGEHGGKMSSSGKPFFGGCESVYDSGFWLVPDLEQDSRPDEQSMVSGEPEGTATGLMNEPRVNIVEWTVSELSARLRKTVEDAFGYVRVRGEVSGFRGAHSSGHCYFSLKDDSAKIEAVIWRSAYGRMKIKPEEGLEVIAT